MLKLWIEKVNFAHIVLVLGMRVTIGGKYVKVLQIPAHCVIGKGTGQSQLLVKEALRKR